MSEIKEKSKRQERDRQKEMIEEEYHSEYFRVCAAIDLDAICSNILNTRAVLDPKTKIMAVIKADGYGHGAIPIARVLDSFVEAYGVAILEEAVELRKAGIKKPILILGAISKEQISIVVAYDITCVVFSSEFAKEVSKEAEKQKKTAKIHIKLDTGMGRIGYQPTKESIADIVKLSHYKNLEIEGLFTHFAKADYYDKSYTKKQLELYIEFADKLQEKGIVPPIKHVSNSAGIIDLPEANFNMVRSGITTYGLYPSDEVKKENLALKPAMELKTHISHIKKLGKGHGIGYGATFITQQDTIVATLPIGYADGYPRSLSNKGKVLIHDQFAPIIGRICMDQFMVDVTKINGVKVGDEVILVGKDKTNSISVEEVANLSESFNYEFVCDVSKRVPRIYYKDGKPFLIRRDGDILLSK